MTTMKRIAFLFAGLLLMAGQTIAQTAKNPRLADEQAVEKVILQLFEGMKSGDSAIVHRACLENVRLATSFTDREGNPGMEEITLMDFLTAVGHPHTETWNEIPQSIQVRIDDNMAVAWVPYTFYVDEQLSHCGVNAFQLVKVASGWKILNITDTRRISGCAPKQ
jgi:hypothetical protein